jgi:hypothetical protein
LPLLLLLLLCVQCLFRSNGSAVLLSNNAADSKRAKYHIRNIVRTNMAADDVAYNCVVQVRRRPDTARHSLAAWCFAAYCLFAVSLCSTV